MNANSKFCIVTIDFGHTTKKMSELVGQIAMRDFSCDGVEEFSLEESRVDEILGERAYSGGDVPETVLSEVEIVTKEQQVFSYKYYFYSEGFEDRVNSFVLYLSNHFSMLIPKVEIRDQEDWNENWRKHYDVINVSENLQVVPEWYKKELADSSKEQIYIYPGQGFGTGTHETTFLCLKMFDELRDRFGGNGFCLDFGCGSGILGIAAIKLSRMQVDFCDIDKGALENCHQNILLNCHDNELDGHHLVIRDRFKLTKKYDVVFANILENILILEKETIISAVKDGGVLIVSGLLQHQMDNIVSEYSQLKVLDRKVKGDWGAIGFVK